MLPFGFLLLGSLGESTKAGKDLLAAVGPTNTLRPDLEL